MSDSEKLNNVYNFINSAVIYPGYGYDYKNAIKLLINGNDFDFVLNWYNKVVGVDIYGN